MPLKVIQPTSAKPRTSLQQVKHVIAVAAGKGGVGKSTITVNLALTLKGLGYKTGILDADIYGPSIRKMLPEDRMPVQRDGHIIPALANGIEMISMAYFRRDGEASAVRAPIANSLIAQFVKGVDWGQLDYLFIDFPPGTGDVQLTLSQQANLSGAVVVTTPQDVALLDVRKAMNLFDQVKVPIIGIVENMSYYPQPGSNERIFIFGKGGGEKLARESGLPLLGQVPIDPAICWAGDKGISIFADDAAGQCPSTEAFNHLARQVIAHNNALQAQGAGCLRSFELVWKETP